MGVTNRSRVRVGLATLLGAVAGLTVTPAFAASTCDPDSLRCAVNAVEASDIHAKIVKRLPTEIDSGWFEKSVFGLDVKVRARFTVDPVGSDPLVALTMSRPTVEASWGTEPGYMTVRARVDESASADMNVHYTLAPSLEADIGGITVNYNTSQLLNMVGGSFNYDSQASQAFLPWGFAETSVTAPGADLDDSTLFSLPFSSLGIGSGTAEGTLNLQATTSPTFHYVTTRVRVDGQPIKEANGAAKVSVRDGDFMEMNVDVDGQITYDGTLHIRPTAVIDSAFGFNTYGYELGFDAHHKDYSSASPLPVKFDATTVHIPLPNVKVPTDGVDFGVAGEGEEQQRSVVIDSTGEMDALLTFESSDPQFVVPSDPVRVSSKSQYELPITFRPTGSDAAKATITVRSNDPDSPEQTFEVGANGADIDDGEGDDGDVNGGDADGDGHIDLGLPPPEGQGGCSVASPGGTSSGFAGTLGLALGLFLVTRRRSRA